MDSDAVRQASLALFAQVRPACVELLALATRPPDPAVDAQVVHTLRALTSTLHQHNDAVLSAKIADYVFFPVLALLKRPLLPTDASRYILDVVAYLTRCAWRHAQDETLLSQLFPLAVYLCGGASIGTGASAIAEADLPLRLAAARCLQLLLHSVPRNYFGAAKRLSFLGDATTLLLDVLATLDAQHEDDCVALLAALRWVYSTRVSPEQTSLVFPGVVSKVVNFCCTTRNLHSATLGAVLATLDSFIVKVFGDLDVSVAPPTTDLHSLKRFLDTPAEPVQVSLASEHAHRTPLWLAATAKQLKLSLLTLFKSLLFSASSRTRVANNARLRDDIVDFVGSVVRRCFRALFADVVMSTFDVLSAVLYVAGNDTLLARAQLIYTVLSRADAELLYRQLVLKTDDLVYTQFKSILLSADDDKIGVCTAAVKLHLDVLQTLQQNLDMDLQQVGAIKQQVLHTVCTEVAHNISVSGKGKKASKNELLQMLAGQSSDNTVDDIELPPYIDAKKLGQVNADKQNLSTALSSMALRKVGVELTDLGAVSGDIQLLGAVYSKQAESQLLSLLHFIGSQSRTEMERLIELLPDSDLAPEPSERLLGNAIPLWVANNLYSTAGDDFSIDDFMDFGEEQSSQDEETSYLLLEKAQTLIGESKDMISENDFAAASKEYKICEMSYAIALESIGLLASRLSKDEFQSDVLMEYLYPILEALTFPPESPAHLQARRALHLIVDSYYGGSLEKLVMDNADYLVDSLSLRLTVASSLTPSLAGILLILLRISGMQLLQSNQLQDILSEIFIVIDSYHGYSTLVENFFLVFEEIVKKTKQLYAKEISDAYKVESNTSQYKPWGLSSRAQMLQLVDDANKQVDPFADYEAEKEYFQRKPGVPFEDSDDDDDEIEEPVKAEPWPSPIPENLYKSIQQIFSYGFQLLSHPSNKVKIQVLRVLKEAYVLMGTNYKVLMPLLAQYWPLLLVLTTGSATMSDIEENSHQRTQLMVPAMELAIGIFEEDKRHELFMLSRFLDMWEFMKRKSPVMDNKAQFAQPARLCSRMLVTGLNNYERLVPDLVAHEMVRVILDLGIQDQPLGRDVKNHIWVLQTQAAQPQPAQAIQAN